ncbi:MAG: archaeosortase/exosortase family protein [Marmoricola sp.]
MVAALAVTAWSTAYRTGEAWATAQLISLHTSTPHYETAWLGRFGSQAIWFNVTTECSSSLIVAPLLALAAGGLMLVGRIAVWRVVLGFIAGAGLFFVLNSGRLAFIGLAYDHWGTQAHWATHDVIGSFITVIASLLALTTQLLVTGVRHGSREVRSFPDDGGDS